MKSSFLLLALLLLGVFSVRAQDLSAAGRRDSAIKVTVIRSGRHAHLLYTLHNEPLTTSTLKPILKRYPPSAEELRKGRAKRRLAFALLPIAAAGIIVGGTQADKHKDEPGSNLSKAPVPFSIGLSAFFGSAILALASDHYGKAIEIYNRQFH